MESGEVSANSKDRGPIEFTPPSVELIPGLEKGIVNIVVGETKTITVPPEEEFGLPHEELVVDIKRSEFSENITLVIGESLQIRHKNVYSIMVTVSGVNEDTAPLAANYLIAGYMLVFDVELVEIA